MKAIITLQRVTTYASTVEMTQEKFDSLHRKLDGSRDERRNAEKELNQMIDTRDWQDDDFHSLDSFEPVPESEQPT